MPDQPAPQNNDAAQFSGDFAAHVQAAQQDDAVNFMNGITTPSPDPAAASPAAEGMPPQPAPIADGGAAPAPGIGRDIGLGILHSPRSVARGTVEGINSILDFGQRLADYLPTVTFLDEHGAAGWTPSIETVGEQKKNISRGLEAQGLPGVPETLDFPVPADNATPTVTGHVIEGIARFVTGFAAMGPIGNAAKVGELLNSGRAAGNILKFTAADLISTDHQEQNLSNVIEKVPALKNPVTEFLAAKPDDGFAEGKLKQAINDLPLGAAGEALFKGIGVLKSAIGAKMAAARIRDTVGAEAAAAAGPEPAHFSALGDAESPELIMQVKNEQAVALSAGIKPGDIGHAAEEPKTYKINFARINGDEDIKGLMDQMVNHPALTDSIDAARRGVQSHADTVGGSAVIDGFNSLMTRRTGAAFNDQQIVAARKIYYETSSKLLEVAKAANHPNAGEIDQFNFRKMLAIHSGVQSEFMGVRAESGRALNAWKIPLAGDADAAAAVSQALADFGGEKASKALAQRLAILGEKLNGDQLNMISQKSTLARTTDAVTEAWTLGLLTNPTTHVVNLGSNVLTGMMLGAERIGAAAFKGGDTDLQEGLAFFTGMMESQKLAVKNMKLAFDTGESGFGLGKIEGGRVRSTARDILDPEGKAGFLSKAVDGYGYFLSRYAGGALGAADEYSKTVLYQAQVRALATREALAQGLQGEALSTYVSSALQKPPASIRADAVEFAQYGTFTKRLGKTGQDVQSVIARNPALRFVAPFVRTPGNIFKFAFERTPLAPLSKNVRADIMAGGTRRATALTRLAMGTSIMAMGADLSQNGIVTGAGPSDPQLRAALRRTGWQPYSVKFGDTYYSYARFEPVATILGMAADMSEIMGNYEAYDLPAQQDVDQLAVAAAIAASSQVVGKTFLEGFADMAQALSDPKRYVPQLMDKYAGSFVPAGAAALERAVDPAMSEVFNMMDAVRSRIPGLSASVPVRFNTWGEPIKVFYPSEKSLAGATAERLLSLFNPVYYSAEKDDPVDRWMIQKGFSVDMPQKIQNFDGVRIDLREHPEIYSRLVELRGNGVKPLKYGSQTMKQFFSNLANEKDPYGRHVSFFMALGKNDFDHQQNFIDQVVRDYTAEAKKQLAAEFGDTIPPLIMKGKLNAAAVNKARGPAGAAQKSLP